MKKRFVMYRETIEYLVAKKDLEAIRLLLHEHLIYQFRLQLIRTQPIVTEVVLGGGRGEAVYFDINQEDKRIASFGVAPGVVEEINIWVLNL